MRCLLGPIPPSVALLCLGHVIISRHFCYKNRNSRIRDEAKKTRFFTAHHVHEGGRSIFRDPSWLIHSVTPPGISPVVKSNAVQPRQWESIASISPGRALNL